MNCPSKSWQSRLSRSRTYYYSTAIHWYESSMKVSLNWLLVLYYCIGASDITLANSVRLRVLVPASILLSIWVLSTNQTHPKSLNHNRSDGDTTMNHITIWTTVAYAQSHLLWVTCIKISVTTTDNNQRASLQSPSLQSPQNAFQCVTKKAAVGSLPHVSCFSWWFPTCSNICGHYWQSICWLPSYLSSRISDSATRSFLLWSYRI